MSNTYIEEKVKQSSSNMIDPIVVALHIICGLRFYWCIKMTSMPCENSLRTYKFEQNEQCIISVNITYFILM